MSKVFIFLIVTTLIAILLFKGIAFYEFDTKQRYISNLVDTVAYKVKITGVYTASEYSDFKTKMDKLSVFNDADIVLRKGVYIAGNLSNMTTYTLGEVLNKGDAFLILVKSSEVSNYSRIENGGVNSIDDTQNVYYKAKAQCRVEKYDE